MIKSSNNMNISKMESVLTACLTGRPIQWRFSEHDNWKDALSETGARYPEFTYEWRVKPEPRELWLCNGRDRRNWIIVDKSHDADKCGGEKIHVREVLE